MATHQRRCPVPLFEGQCPFERTVELRSTVLPRSLLWAVPAQAGEAVCPPTPTEPVSVEKQIVYRDSLVYADRIVTRTVEVEKKLSWWQALKMKAGGVALLVIALAILYFMFNLLNLKRP